MLLTRLAFCNLPPAMKLEEVDLLQTPDFWFFLHGPVPWYFFDNRFLNDNNTDIATGISANGKPESNNGRGIEMIFKRPISLGRLKLWQTKQQCDILIECYDGAHWNTIHQFANAPGFANPTADFAVFDFNQDAAIKSDRWRWTLQNWVDTTDHFVLYEAEAFERLIA